IIRLLVRMSLIAGPLGSSATILPLFAHLHSPLLSRRVPADDPLFGPLDGERPRRHVAGDDRTRPGRGSLSDLDRGDHHRIRADERVVSDGGPVLGRAAVVHGHDVRAVAAGGVRDPWAGADARSRPDPGLTL